MMTMMMNKSFIICALLLAGCSEFSFGFYGNNPSSTDKTYKNKPTQIACRSHDDCGPGKHCMPLVDMRDPEPSSNISVCANNPK